MHPRLVLAIAAIGIAIATAAASTAVFAQAASSSPPNLATAHVEQTKLECNACHGDKTPTSVSPEEALATVNQNCINCHGDAKAMAAAILPKLVHKDTAACRMPSKRWLSFPKIRSGSIDGVAQLESELW